MEKKSIAVDDTANAHLQESPNYWALDVTPNVNFLTTLRNSGYSNYTAIADIVDNALDTNVDAENINIYIKTNKDAKKNGYESIEICDDGCGMTLNTLKEAFKLGAVMGKVKRNDLGAYGTGLKTAALSMCRRLEVKTRSVNDYFYVVTYDLDAMIEQQQFAIPIIIGSEEEYDIFKKKVGAEYGTIITLSVLDRVTNQNITQFRNKLIKDFGVFYKIFIEEYNIKIAVDGVIVTPIDPMYRNELFSKRLSSLNEKFSYLGQEFSFNAYYLTKIDKNINDSIELPRSYNNRGLYIYRNNRLVGAGLDLGIINKYGDGYYNGLRIELFVDGESDELFGSTFMKMIHERSKEDVDQGFRDACNKAISPYIRATYIEEKNAGTKNEIDNDTVNEFKNIIDDINKNKLINVQKVGGKRKLSENEPKVNDDNKQPKQKHRFAHRRREDAFTDWRFVTLGEGGNLFNVSREMGKYVVYMNTDHVFWQEFLCKSTNETKGVLIRLFVSMAISLDSIGYYDDEDKEELLQEYLLEMSTNLRKLIIG